MKKSMKSKGAKESSGQGKGNNSGNQGKGKKNILCL